MNKFTKNVLIYLTAFTLLGAGGLINQDKNTPKIPKIKTQKITKNTRPIAKAWPKISTSSSSQPTSSSSVPSSSSASSSSSSSSQPPQPAKPAPTTQASQAAQNDNHGQHRGIHWDDPKNITVKIVTNNPDAVNDFKQAIDAWNKTGIVNLKLVDQNQAADITCNVENLSNQTKQNGDYTQATLGQTDFQYEANENKLISATSNIDIDQIKSLPDQNQVWIAEHELGHALGLQHANENDNSVMIPFNIHTGITDEDVQHLKDLYS